MLRTKLEVDKHVENCLKKINSQAERNQRYFSFARLYFNIGEYEQARRYLSSYLSAKPKSAEGYHLLGKTLEKLGKKDAALEAYRTSLQIDPKQNNLVIKVCELLSSDDVNVDQSGARYFCEMAQSFDPYNPAVFSLKERLIMTENKDPSEVSALLLKELEDRPTDVNLRVLLLKHFLQYNMIQEAYKHVSDIENKNLTFFHSNVKWYEVIAEILLRYQRDSSLNTSLTWDYWFMSVSVLDRLVSLSLDEHSDNIKICSEYVNTVFNFDQTLMKASENIDSCPDRNLAQEFLTHYRGQLCFHLATLIFKQAKKDFIKFKDACNVSLPILFGSYHTEPVDLQALWVAHTTESRRNLLQRWNKEASFRCSQAGHILNSLAKDRKSALLEKASQYSTGIWREYLFKKVFITRDHQLKINTSYFVTCPQLTDITIRLPDPVELLTYDEVGQLLHPDSLHHYIWVALNHKLSDFPLTTFEGLPYSVKNLTNCAAESLSVLDVQAFIYCASLCAQSQLAELKNLIYYNPEKPNVLPAAITEQLGTNNQAKFIAAAYKLYKKDYTADFGELRLLLIKGLEVIRCIGHHGLDVKLLVLLANIFAERSKKLSKQSEVEFNDARAELYWKTALPLLERLKNNQAVVYSNNRWFEYKTKDMSMNEICTYIEKGKLFTGVVLMKKKEHDKALKVFESLRDPYASFYQAQIYKQMADQITSHNKENVTSEMRSQNIIVLSRARDCLYLTLDRLREPSVERNHPLNAQLGTEIENIERLLSRIDPDCIHRNDCDGMSDENVSSADSVGDHYVTGVSLHHSSYLSTTFPHRNDTHNIHSTPLRAEISRREARPSPERLDAQLRQLAATKDASINHILEQNKVMVDSHRSLVEELRSFKEAVYNLTSTVDELKIMKQGFQELKEIKKSVDELKASVDELQNFKNVTDTVYEMRKEISELKRDVSKQPNQLSDEDLCILDSEYGGGEYNNMGSHMTPNYPQNLYPNYQGRLPAPNPLPYGALYPGMYSPMAAYPYGGLGLPQPGPLPYSPDQQIAAELRAIHLGQVQPAVSYGHAPSALGQPLMQPVITPSTLGAIGPPTTQPLLSQVSSPSNLYPKISSTVTAAPNLFQTITTTYQTITASTSVTPSNKAPPLNVVITSSDPLPSTLTSVPQKPLSVTIPPQHLKGNISKSQPHNYQIPLPTMSLNTSNTPSVLSKPAPLVSTQSILSNVGQPMYSAVDRSPLKNVSLGLQIEKTLDLTFSPSKSDIDTSKLNSSNVSNTSLIDEHDPRPDFKPIVPLPDEIPVHTGEEDEIVLFSERAKLYRFDSKEWKERGVGILKILHNPKNNKFRILMRRDQVHKICANHFLTTDMSLAPMPRSDKEFIWAAQDYADEHLVMEKLCVRFKTFEEARKFNEAFEKVQKSLKDAEQNNSSVSPVVPKLADIKFNASENKPDSTTKPCSTLLGGFVFSSPPTFKPKSDGDNTPKTIVAQEPVKGSPFAGFTFTKQQQPATNLFAHLQSDFKPFKVDTSTPKADSSSSKLDLTPVKVDIKPVSPIKAGDDDSHTEDFVPTAEFKPVVPLPELVDVKTGEENAEVIFESRAKLLRFDTSGETKEWKERGIGTMKVLKENIVRLVMRREQVHKVCCNHQLFKKMSFQKMAANHKAVTWCAQDFSEGVVRAETFALRFKTSEQADEFLEVIADVQVKMDENSNIPSEKSTEVETSPPASKKDLNNSSGTQELNVSGGGKPIGFGDKFKAAKGSWECKNCYIVNDSKCNYCAACDSPKNSTIPPKKSTSESSGTSFSFGIPVSSSQGFLPVKAGSQEAQKTTFSSGAARTTTDKDQTKLTESKADTKTVGWGDAFKPQEGSWECKLCLVRNKPDVLYCASCENPKDDTVPAKETNMGINLDTGGQKFSFGIPFAASSAPTSTFTFGQPATNFSAQFAFGAKTAAPSTPTNIFSNTTSSFSFAKSGSTADKDDSAGGEKFVFGSPQKHDFGFTPRSPRRVSSGQGDEDSEDSYEEEGDNIYFKPVIPLPDKVDVVTGEEEESVLYCHRAKLFRYASGEWKERGLGDIKVLKNKKTGKLRVVMRREQVLKICLNHALTSDIEYIEKDDKTWLFSAPDFSEGEINHHQFCLRFKTPEIAQEFNRAITDALKNAPVLHDKAGEDKSAKEDESDVEFISETKVTPEEEKEAEKLGLPPKFMAYRQLPDCTCKQCQKDDEYFGEALEKSTKQIDNVDKSSTPAGGKKKSESVSSNPVSSTSLFGTPFSTFTTQSSGDSIFGTPKEQTSISPAFSVSSVGSVNTASDSPKLKELLVRPPLLNAPKLENQSPLSFVIPQKSISETSMTSSNVSVAGNLFGSRSTGNLGTAGIAQSQSTKSELPPTFSFAAPKLNVSTPATSPSGIFSSTLAASNGTPATTTTTVSSGLFASPATTGGLFGSPAAGLFKSSTTSNLFGSSTLGGNIFGGAATTGSIFGTTATTPTSAPGTIFGAPSFTGGSLFNSEKTSGSGGSIFSGTTTTVGGVFTSSTVTSTTTPLFGHTTSSVSGTPGNIFTAQVDTKQAPVFGQSSANLFGNSSIFGQNKTTLFGGFDTSKATPTFGSVGQLAQEKPTIFGSTAQTDLDQKNLFGSAASTGQDKSLNFASLSQKSDDAKLGTAAKESQQISGIPKEGDEVVLKCDGNISFATLAAKTSEDAPPAFNKKSDDATPFAFLGAGRPVFASLKKKEAKKTANESTEGEEADEGNNTGTGEEEYDPHYEPIVPLPDAIVVSTGEEDEVVEFNERAKLYRYDDNTKEWKERGVGQMKILHHPVNRTYRFLLRREQVHKVVLNQLITSDLDLQPMVTSDKAWVWGGYNYTDDGSSLEKLAIRFKNCELAKQFYSTVQNVLVSVRDIQANKSLPSVLHSYSLEDITPEESELQIQEINEDEEYEDDDDCDDDDRSVMCMKRCILSEQVQTGQWVPVAEGDIQIYYDSELYAAKIGMNDDDGVAVSNTLIGLNTLMEKNGKDCIWRAVEWATDQLRFRILKATFSSVDDASEFHYNYEEGVHYAKQCEIMDVLPSNNTEIED